MTARILYRAAAVLAALAFAAACVFPLDADIQQGTERPLVVEGGIHPGNQTIIKLSYVQPFGQEEYIPIYAKAYIECEDGSKVQGEQVGDSLLFDTSACRADKKYRLHFDTREGKGGEVLGSFESDWLEVTPGPVIDELTFAKDAESGSTLNIGISMRCRGGQYFRWTFFEDWEYHSELWTDLYYLPDTREVKAFERGVNPYYYCWSHYDSPEINLFSTVNQTEDRFEDLEFHRVLLRSQKLQIMYRITVQLEALPREAYEYWSNIERNTEEQGSLFAPIPSEIIGNVRCISDPSVQVLGYVNASVMAVSQMYYDDKIYGYCTYSSSNDRSKDDETGLDDPIDYGFMYKYGYWPYRYLIDGMPPQPVGVQWAPRRCIDCTKFSDGTKNKPKGWPTDHV